MSQTMFSDWGVEHIELDDQDPEADGFWDRWKGYIDNLGRFDYVIGSEDYCSKVAEVIGARYIPYDPNRELNASRGTHVRENLIDCFDEVSDIFQHHLRLTVTVFGAESTGKTTLSKTLAEDWGAEWLFEWARPYLEATHQTVVDLQAMHDIWHGQKASEDNATFFARSPFIFRDTDLYSTIGYWEQPHWEADLGPVPEGLILDAKANKADLYIITPSNIPFEQDPLRYGGDHRESPDEYWIKVAEKYNLPYVVLDADDLSTRLDEADEAIVEAFERKNHDLITYKRRT
jgi:NadR type nicotinamide-nucleotide adenylyltransferase